MTDIRALIDSRPISGLQYTVVALCFLMNMLDGMDVLIISYAAQALATEWAISPRGIGNRVQRRAFWHDRWCDFSGSDRRYHR